MKNLTLKNIAIACQGQLVGAKNEELEISSVVTDSRQIEENTLFLAIKGERVDGHKFIPQVIKAGAAAAVCEEEPADGIGPYILVESVLKALQDIAAYYRDGLDIPVVGITGSVGKTSTKEFVATVLEQKYKVLKTEGNFNNEIGVPLTLLKIRDEHQIAVVEMGINHFGEMHRLGRMTRPDVMVFTNIGDSHLEFLESRDGILKAKTEVFDEMKQGSTVIVKAEDDKLSTIQTVLGKNPIRYGFDQKADVYATEVSSKGLLGSEVIIQTKDGILKAVVPLPGNHMIYNALAATAVGLQFNLNLVQIKKGLESVRATGGRSNIIQTSNYIIVDDCYNANPSSMCAAIDLLMQADSRKVAILGDMFELGGNESELHAEVGRYAAQSDLNLLICIGKVSKYMAEAARGIKETVYFEKKEVFLAEMDKWIHKNDTILIKASHSMGFESIVEQLQKEI